MSLGQTMLSIATLVALTIMVVTSQRYLIEGQKESVEAECFDLATSQCEALLAEISRKKFDASAVYTYYQSPSDFTLYSQLGPNTTERNMVTPWPDIKPYKSNTSFDDVDDFHTYQRTVNTDLVSGIRLTVQVYYVESTNPETKVYHNTYLKRIVVTATHSTYLQPITFSTLAAY
jgi:hypothetical protein